MSKFNLITIATALALVANGASAEAEQTRWTLEPTLSNVAFGSIKNDYIGESHNFRDISGSVSPDGTVEILLQLGSVKTQIDIRNERIIEHVFKKAPTATITAKIDMEMLNGLPVRAATLIETSGTLSLLGKETELDASLFVMRPNEDQVMVTSDGLLMLSTEDAGLDAGIDILQQLAGLDSITRVSPISLRLFFNQDLNL